MMFIICCKLVLIIYNYNLHTDNPKLKPTMQDVVDGTIGLVLQDNGKATTLVSPRAKCCDFNPIELGFNLIFHEGEFDITAESELKKCEN